MRSLWILGISTRPGASSVAQDMTRHKAVLGRWLMPSQTREKHTQHRANQQRTVPAQHLGRKAGRRPGRAGFQLVRLCPPGSRTSQFLPRNAIDACCQTHASPVSRQADQPNHAVQLEPTPPSLCCRRPPILGLGVFFLGGQTHTKGRKEGQKHRPHTTPRTTTTHLTPTTTTTHPGGRPGNKHQDKQQHTGLGGRACRRTNPRTAQPLGWRSQLQGCSVAVGILDIGGWEWEWAWCREAGLEHRQTDDGTHACLRRGDAVLFFASQGWWCCGGGVSTLDVGLPPRRLRMVLGGCVESGW